MWSGNNNQCLDVMDCQGASIGGNRCLPNSCFQKTLMSKDNFDLANYNETLFQEAGYSEAEIMAALAESKSERAFLQMSQFLALSSELHSNATTQCPFGIEQKPALIHAKMKMSRFPTLDCTLKYRCVQWRWRENTAAILFWSRVVISAEISVIVGFSNANKTEDLLCGAAFADADIVILVAVGAALGCGFNGVFTTSSPLEEALDQELEEHYA